MWPSYLVYFTPYSISEVYPCCHTNQNLIAFHGWVIVHRMSSPHLLIHSFLDGHLDCSHLLALSGVFERCRHCLGCVAAPCTQLIFPSWISYGSAHSPLSRESSKRPRSCRGQWELQGLTTGNLAWLLAQVLPLRGGDLDSSKDSPSRTTKPLLWL